MDAVTLMNAELRRLRARRPEVSGTVLAGTDGLLIASDLGETAAVHLAALAAASFGLGQQVALAVDQGEFREHVVRTTTGQVVVYPAGAHALLALVALAGTEPETLHHEARAVAGRVGGLFDARRADYVDPVPPVSCGPLVARTPLATLPAHLRRSVPVWHRPPL